MAKDPYRYFRVEARELLDGLSRGLLKLEKAPADSSALKEVLRLAHTLKGAARVVKQLEIADLAHAIEDALAPMRDGSAPLEREQFNGLFAQLDGIGKRVAALEPQAPAIEVAAPPSDALEPTRLPVEALDSVVRGLSEAAVQARSLRQSVSGLDPMFELASALHEQLASPRFAEAMSSAAGRRVVGMAAELRGALDRVRGELTAGVGHAEAELAQVRDDADQLRLLPAGSIFGALERVAREAASALHKRVRFEARGAEVRLDAHVLRSLRDALAHVVRNAVAHGIESPGEREASGKPRDGQVAVSFERRGPRVAFVCRDDGRGVDVAAVEAVARKRGLIGPTDRLDAPRASALLLSGGLSTSESVTEVAGRGIGLDVVRATARGLKGEVSMTSERGVGTTVELRVPVSLSSARALLVDVGGARMCVPLDAVRRTVQLRPEQVARGAEAESVELDGEVFPFASLARVLRRPANAAARGPRPALVLDVGGRSAALAVERLVGTAEVVVRRLPAALQAEPFIAGAALDADGTPLLVLEPEGALAATLKLEREAEEPARPAPSVLVVDDSLTTRMLEQSILESAGYQVQLASTGEEGLEKARQSRFDIFLVDIEMPGIDGFEFIRRCNDDPMLHGTPAILVSSRSSDEDRRRGEQAGARAYIVKGEFEQGTLLRNIRELVR